MFFGSQFYSSLYTCTFCIFGGFCRLFSFFPPSSPFWSFYFSPRSEFLLPLLTPIVNCPPLISSPTHPHRGFSLFVTILNLFVRHKVNQLSICGANWCEHLWTHHRLIDGFGNSWLVLANRQTAYLLQIIRIWWIFQWLNQKNTSKRGKKMLKSVTKIS